MTQHVAKRQRTITLGGDLLQDVRECFAFVGGADMWVTSQHPDCRDGCREICTLGINWWVGVKTFYFTSSYFMFAFYLLRQYVAFRLLVSTILFIFQQCRQGFIQDS